MTFNLILNSNFNGLNRWNLINCKYENNTLISTDKVFGIEQELILPDICKLYFRTWYKSINPELFNIKIGIQNNKILEVNEKQIKPYEREFISLVDNAKQEKIKIHIIFESTVKNNKVEIYNPLLVNLNQLHKSTWLKWLLDKTVNYMDGYNYINEYSSEITKDIEDFKNIDLQQAKIGSIINTSSKIEVPISAKFIDNNYYLVKLDYKEINRFGKVYFNYGILKSSKINDEQCYLLFRASQDKELKLNIEGNDVLPYIINLKHILLINITHLRLMREDIGYLPFI